MHVCSYNPKLYRKVVFLFCFTIALLSRPILANEQILRHTFESWQAGYPATIENLTLDNIDMLNIIYEERTFTPIWFQNVNSVNTPRPKLKEFLNILANIDQEGLMPSDYHIYALQNLPTDTPNLVHDILVTDVFLTLSQHLLRGKVNPATLSIEWDANSKLFNSARQITDLNEHGVTAALENMRPKMPEYFELKQYLKKMRALPQIEWSALASSPALKPSYADARISDISERLFSLGYLSAPPDLNSNDRDFYSSELVSQVKVFQKDHGLEADGIIGKKTISMLNMSPKQRINAIIVNLERYRWLDHTLGDSYVVVNIANFELKAIKNGQQVMQMPVIVGNDFRKTPVFSDIITYLVFNPTWTVPQTIAIQDILPAIKKDHDYLSKKQFTLHPFDSNIDIDASTIDWQSLRNRFPYRLVQQPGPLNALGQIKFMFPNKYDVYLHDTPAKDLFSKNQRAFSSGCIRVARPFDLAAFLLEAQGIDTNQITAIAEAKALKTIRLKERMPVHLEYLTAWVEPDDGLQIRADIYSRDEPVLAALSTPLQ